MIAQTLQTVANIAAIVAGIAAGATLVLVVLDRRPRIKIDYYVGDDPPSDWMAAARIPRKTPADPLVVFWVRNVGATEESLYDAYIDVPGGRNLHVFSGGNPTMPSPLQPEPVPLASI